MNSPRIFSRAALCVVAAVAVFAGVTGLTATPAPQIAAVAASASPSSGLYADAAVSSAATAAGEHPEHAAVLNALAATPTAKWIGDWTPDPRTAVSEYLDRANGATGQIVIYAVPGRDCGGHSGGGVDADTYRNFVKGVRDAIGDRPVYVIVEPDALALTDCLDDAGRTQRSELVAEAVRTLREAPGAKVYLDAGHSKWHSAAEMAERLRGGGVADAHGFALNVSNHRSDAETIAYGKEISAQIGGAGFVVDSSRNGGGDIGDEWCNTSGRRVGRVPTTDTGDAAVHAYLWVKVPGESDGNCNGGPTAGQFWLEGALELTQGWNPGTSAPAPQVTVEEEAAEPAFDDGGFDEPAAPVDDVPQDEPSWEPEEDVVEETPVTVAPEEEIVEYPGAVYDPNWVEPNYELYGTGFTIDGHEAEALMCATRQHPHPHRCNSL